MNAALVGIFSAGQHQPPGFSSRAVISGFSYVQRAELVV
jgi:hypothetical protein